MCKGDPVELIDENIAVYFISVLSLTVIRKQNWSLNGRFKTISCHAMQFVCSNGSFSLHVSVNNRLLVIIALIFVLPIFLLSESLWQF